MVDGRIACDLIPELALPRLPRWKFYSKFLRPFLFALLTFLTSLSLVRWLASFVFGFLVSCVQPQSKGSLSMSTMDPRYLSDERDRLLLRRGITATRSLLRNYKALRYVEILPGPLFLYTFSKHLADSFISLFATTYFHACGTCAMGVVVDDELKVKGVHGLRVADASVFPWIPTAPIAGVCMAVGLRLGELLTAASAGDRQKGKI